jgi:hypothetical protein
MIMERAVRCSLAVSRFAPARTWQEKMIKRSGRKNPLPTSIKRKKENTQFGASN